MLAEMETVGTIKLKFYKDFHSFMQKRVQGRFEKLFVYPAKYDGEDEDFVYYHIEVPTREFRGAIYSTEGAIDTWVEEYKKQKGKKKISIDKYIWE